LFTPYIEIAFIAWLADFACAPIADIKLHQIID